MATNDYQQALNGSFSLYQQAEQAAANACQQAFSSTSNPYGSSTYTRYTRTYGTAAPRTEISPIKNAIEQCVQDLKKSLE